MTEQEAEQLLAQIEKVFEHYIPGAWFVSEFYYDKKTVLITIEYDNNKIDWDLVDEMWESRAEEELRQLCTEWGALYDWRGPVVEIKLVDYTIQD